MNSEHMPCSIVYCLALIHMAHVMDADAYVDGSRYIEKQQQQK